MFKKIMTKFWRFFVSQLPRPGYVLLLASVLLVTSSRLGARLTCWGSDEFFMTLIPLAATFFVWAVATKSCFGNGERSKLASGFVHSVSLLVIIKTVLALFVMNPDGHDIDCSWPPTAHEDRWSAVRLIEAKTGRIKQIVTDGWHKKDCARCLDMQAVKSAGIKVNNVSLALPDGKFVRVDVLGRMKLVKDEVRLSALFMEANNPQAALTDAATAALIRCLPRTAVWFALGSSQGLGLKCDGPRDWPIALEAVVAENVRRIN